MEVETGNLQKEAKQKLLDLTGEVPFALLTEGGLEVI